MLKRGLGCSSDKANANANDIYCEIFATTIKVIKRNKEILRTNITNDMATPKESLNNLQATTNNFIIANKNAKVVPTGNLASAHMWTVLL